VSQYKCKPLYKKKVIGGILANMTDSEHFRRIAKYLEERGWIGEAVADYGVFFVTATGIDEVTG
jgi:hypothetical protein